MQNSQKNSNSVKHSNAVATINSRNELPVYQQDGSLRVSAMLLWKKLEVKTKFSMWFQRRVEEYEFEKNFDFFDGSNKKFDFPSLGNQRGGDRRSVDYSLTTKCKYSKGRTAFGFLKV